MKLATFAAVAVTAMCARGAVVEKWQLKCVTGHMELPHMSQGGDMRDVEWCSKQCEAFCKYAVGDSLKDLQNCLLPHGAKGCQYRADKREWDDADEVFRDVRLDYAMLTVS